MDGLIDAGNPPSHVDIKLGGVIYLRGATQELSCPQGSITATAGLVPQVHGSMTGRHIVNSHFSTTTTTTTDYYYYYGPENIVKSGNIQL